MKALKTLLIFLLGATSVFAQVDPNNLFIQGYVTDSNGNAQEGVLICVDQASQPSFPLDSLCTLTNANGYYAFEIPNGSVTGPNIDFTLSMDDPCPNTPGYQIATVSNEQGTNDFVTLNWLTCESSNTNCSASFTAANDSTNGANGLWTFTANATGTAPYTYDWWVNGASYSTQTVTHTFNGGTVGVYLTVTDADGCVSTDGDTLFLGNPSQGCSSTIVVNEDSLGGVLNAELIAVASGVAPFQYEWSTGATTESIYLEDLVGLDSVCITITDANGCVSTSCEIVGYEPNQGCFVSITTTVDSNLVGLVYTLTASSGFDQYSWSTGEIGQSITIQNQSPNGDLYCVTATNANSCTATACDTLLPIGGGSSCNAFFVWEESNILGSPLPTVEFTDLSANAVYWFWDFGDNTTSTDQNPLHVYNTAGTYGVCLTIVNADQSCQQTYCDTVTVGNPNTGGCNAAFSNSGPTPIGYTFSANVQNPDLYYYWEVNNAYVGDGYEAYVPGFTNGVHTICLTVVDSLIGCSDTQCLTLTVGSPNNCYGYISGQVYAGSNSNPVDQGVVYLISLDAVTNQLSVVDSMVVDSGNYYFFGPLACGDYLIKAAAYSTSPYYSNHIPTYFGNSPFWGFAQTVSISQPNAQFTADVTLIAANNPGGPGVIEGDVTQGANKVDPGDPIAGMQVMLFNLSGSAVAYTFTDETGQFGFENLAYGTYQVYVEALGVQTIPAVVTIDANEPAVDGVHILASESLISTGIEEFDFEGAISEVYPNPVLNNASINLNLETEVEVNISVLDLTGRAVSTRTVSMTSGENTHRISTDQLKGGYYFLNIQDVEGTFSITRKFMRVD